MSLMELECRTRLRCPSIRLRERSTSRLSDRSLMFSRLRSDDTEQPAVRSFGVRLATSVAASSQESFGSIGSAMRVARRCVANVGGEVLVGFPSLTERKSYLTRDAK